MKDQIKEALEKANLPYKVCEETGDLLDGNDNTVADFIYHEEDAHLIANAPTWIRWQNERIEQLEKALEDIETHIGDFTKTGVEHFRDAYIEVKRIARDARTALGKKVSK